MLPGVVLPHLNVVKVVTVNPKQGLWTWRVHDPAVLWWGMVHAHLQDNTRAISRFGCHAYMAEVVATGGIRTTRHNWWVC
jgi:hypothetical protein